MYVPRYSPFPRSPRSSCSPVLVSLVAVSLLSHLGGPGVQALDLAPPLSTAIPLGTASSRMDLNVTYMLVIPSLHLQPVYLPHHLHVR